MWKPITGYEGLYEVSDQGQVYSVLTDKIMRPSLSGAGYPHLQLSKGGVKSGFYVHCLVALLFIGPKPEKHDVNHKNGSKTDNRAENLEYITHSENLKHSSKVLGNKHGNWTNIGELHHNSVVTTQTVLAIRKLHADGCTIQYCATRFDILHSTAAAIIHRRTWKHI